jgi:tetratricopeptide (TPR) repeat protein
MMRAVFTSAFGIGVAIATVTHVLANPAADCNWTTNDPADVVHVCTTLLAEEKTAEPWMYFNRALAFKMLGQLENAYRDYSRAIELNPAFGAPYTNRGNLRLLRNDIAGAMADFRTALKLDPGDQVARENLEALRAALRKVGAGKSGEGAATGPAR